MRLGVGDPFDLGDEAGIGGRRALELQDAGDAEGAFLLRQLAVRTDEVIPHAELVVRLDAQIGGDPIVEHDFVGEPADDRGRRSPNERAKRRRFRRRPDRGRQRSNTSRTFSAL